MLAPFLLDLNSDRYRLTRILTAGLIVTAAAIAGGAISLVSNPLWILLGIVILLGIALFVRYPELGVGGYIFSTALNRYVFDVWGWQMRIEHAVLGMLVIALVIRAVSGKGRVTWWPAMSFIAALIGVNVVSSFVHSGDVYKSVRIISRMVLAALGYLIIAGFADNPKRLQRLVGVLLLTIAAEALFGLVAIVLWQTQGVNIGMQQSAMTGTWQPYGTIWEGNIFGSYLMVGALMSLVLLLSRDRTYGKGFLLLVLALTSVGMAFSLARAAWIGFAFGAILLILLMRNVQLRGLLAVLVLAAALLFVGRSANPGGVFDVASSRVDTLQSLSIDPNVSIRLQTVDLALREWQQHAMLGWGTDGFRINHPERAAALPSPQLAALYDTGVVGLLLFVAMLAALLVPALATALKSGPNQTVARALVVSFVGLLVAYQATDAFWLSFTWVHVALLTAAVAVANAPALARDGAGG